MSGPTRTRDEDDYSTSALLSTPVDNSSLFSDSWHRTSDELAPDDQASTQNVGSSDSYPASPVETKVRCKSPSLFAVLMPYARGPENYYLGEAQDAFDVGSLIFALNLLRGHPVEFAKTGMAQPRVGWACLKTFQTLPPAFLFFGLLTTSGIDYRRYGLSGVMRDDKDFIKWLEPRTEETAEHWQKVGAAVGVMGGLLAVKRPGPAHIRPLSMIMGCTIMGAGFANHFSNISSGNLVSLHD